MTKRRSVDSGQHEFSVPDAAVVRERLARNRREATFLRRLLRLALDAERTEDKKRSVSEANHA